MLLDSNDQFQRADQEGRVNLAFDSAEFTENGVVGDPREARTP